MNIPNWLHREVAVLNQELGRVLGRTADGQPLYKWIHSEDQALLHPMWTGEFDYKANEQSGLILPTPIFTLRKMCLTAEDQWVLCHWIDSPPEHEWRQIFGCSMEWPKGGQYYPTNVILDPGAWPERSITQTAIECINLNRNKTARQVEREATEAMDKRERDDKQRLYEEIREECTTYDHVPGARDQVSYPSVTKEMKLICPA
jgi:hypothetical protein